MQDKCSLHCKTDRGRQIAMTYVTSDSWQGFIVNIPSPLYNTALARSIYLQNFFNLLHHFGKIIFSDRLRFQPVCGVHRKSWIPNGKMSRGMGGEVCSVGVSLRYLVIPTACLPCYQVVHLSLSRNLQSRLVFHWMLQCVNMTLLQYLCTSASNHK